MTSARTSWFKMGAIVAEQRGLGDVYAVYMEGCSSPNIWCPGEERHEHLAGLRVDRKRCTAVPVQLEQLSCFRISVSGVLQAEAETDTHSS